MIKQLIKSLKSDKGYRMAWQANIAMAFYDNAYWYKKRHNKKSLSQKDIHKIGNEAADYFLNLLCR